MLQRSKEWRKAREGRFTASRASELLTTGRRDMTPEEMEEYKAKEPKGRRKTIDCIGDSLYTYALEAAGEVLFGYDESKDFVSFDMQRGIDLEPVAFEHFKAKKELLFLDVEEVGFVPYKDYAGASSDGYVSDNSGLEIKCPNRVNYLKIVTQGIDAVDPKYIDQMQMQMLCTNSVKAYFFNYIIFNGVEMWHEIEVQRDEQRIELIKERIEEAIKIKQDLIEYLIKNKQF